MINIISLSVMRINKLILSAALCLAGLTSFAQTKINISFASVERAQQLITEDDHYIQGLSQFDIDSRLGKTGGTLAELKELQKKECREWSQAQIDTVTKSFALLEEYLAKGGYHIPVPEEVVMILTTMHEEGDAGAYTRENRIFIGEDCFGPRTTAEGLVSLMAHELFHVLTRRDLEFKRQMYLTIGFTRMYNEIVFPEELLQRRISNPDVSCYDSYAMLKVNDEIQTCTMINVASREYEGGSFFRYLKVGFIPLDEQLKPIMENDKTVVYDLNQAVNFYDKVGKNTGYVINPEECLADNFAIAVCGSPRPVPNPEVIEKIQKVLREYTPENDAIRKIKLNVDSVYNRNFKAKKVRR